MLGRSAYAADRPGLGPNPRVTVQRLRSVAAKLLKIDEELQLVSEVRVGKSGNAGPVVLAFVLWDAVRPLPGPPGAWLR